MKLHTQSFKQEYWPQLQQLINQYWKKNHPISNWRLFRWQYRGFGPLSSDYISQVLLHEDRIVGFRGCIPGQFRVPTPEGMTVLPSGTFALSIILPEYRGRGLGYIKMLKAIQQKCPILQTCGANIQTTVPIKKALNFSYLSKLNRYVIPLEWRWFKQLFAKSNDTTVLDDFEVIEFSETVDRRITPTPAELEKLWNTSTDQQGFFGLNRNADFWKWRYFESPGFKYFFFGDPNAEGVVVFRIEKTFSPEEPSTHGLKVLRIIEIIPRNPKVWKGYELTEIKNLLCELLSWAGTNDCVAADYQCSNDNLGSVLNSVGFRNTNSLVEVFRPYNPNAMPINAMWRVTDPRSDRIIKIDANETYFVKSDGDMDRPNLIGDIHE